MAKAKGTLTRDEWIDKVGIWNLMKMTDAAKSSSDQSGHVQDMAQWWFNRATKWCKAKGFTLNATVEDFDGEDNDD